MKRLALLTLGAVVPAIAALLGLGGVANAAADPAWFTYSRPATYSAVYSFVQVPMRDGNKLACDLQQPGTGTPGQLDAPGSTPAPARFPGVISNYTPYVAGNPASATTASPLATLGYDVLNCDPRGLGRSQVTAPGQMWTQPYASIQTQDNYDMIEWLAAQPFSNGMIGQTGGSAGAVTSTLVATLRPPHLRAIVPLTAPDDMYLNSRYKGGALVAWGPAWAVANGALSAGGGNPAVVIAQFLQHPNEDSYWSQQSPDSSFGTLGIPDLQLEGWGDTDFPTGALRIFEGTKGNISASDPNNTGPWVIQGPWGHAGSPTCSPAGGCGVTLAWFDRQLRHMASAPVAPARIEIFQQPDPGGHGWQFYPDWPPAGTVPLNLHLDQAAKIAVNPDPAATASFIATQSDIATAGTAVEQPTQYLQFTSDPVAQDTTVIGNPLLKLRAVLTATNGIFVTQLKDVAPDGTTTNASAVPWILKASHRTGFASQTPVTPGQVTDYSVPGWSIDYLFQKGHRISLKIASAVDVLPPATPFPNNLVETAPNGTVSLATGLSGSYIQLPILGSASFAPSAPAPIAGAGSGLPGTSAGVPLGAAASVVAGILACAVAAVLVRRRRRMHSRIDVGRTRRWTDPSHLSYLDHVGSSALDGVR
jgi:predicted acyl esterase